MQALPTMLMSIQHQFHGLSLVIIEPVSVRLQTSPNALRRGLSYARRATELALPREDAASMNMVPLTVS